MLLWRLLPPSPPPNGRYDTPYLLSFEASFQRLMMEGEARSFTLHSDLSRYTTTALNNTVFLLGSPPPPAARACSIWRIERLNLRWFSPHKELCHGCFCLRGASDGPPRCPRCGLSRATLRTRAITGGGRGAAGPVRWQQFREVRKQIEICSWGKENRE